MKEKKREWARRQLNHQPGLTALFEAEIRNENNGGVRPSTLSSAIDSVMQMPDDILDDMTGDESRGVLVALLMLRDRLPGSTRLEELLP